MIWWMFLGCGSNPNKEPVVENGVSWEPCKLQFDDKGPWTQCATRPIPLRHTEPEGETIDVFAQRMLQDGDNVLWMLPGGPGQTGAVYESFIKDLARALPDTDIYIYEHRGVGRSTRLSCPDQEAPDSDGGIDVTLEEWPDCLAHAEANYALDAFTSAAAADDLADWIDVTANDRPVFVYGASYGTTLAHRFLQQYPDLADGVVLDSLAIDVDHRVYDAEYDLTARGVLDLCAADDRCSEMLGADPEVRAREVMDSVRDGDCAALDDTVLRRGAGAFAADASLRGFAPALFHRGGRCDEDDVKDLERLRALFEDRPPHYTEELYSPILFANIELSEQWPEPWPSLETLESEQLDYLFGLDLSTRQRPLLDIWPRYDFDYEQDTALAETDTPLLMLHGDLDPQTPPERTEAAEAHFSGPGQTMVRFPFGTHILVGSTSSNEGDCATHLIAQFMEDPLADLDARCVDSVDGPDFTGQALTSWLLFSDCGRYGNGCGGKRAMLLLGILAFAIRRRRQE